MLKQRMEIVKSWDSKFDKGFLKLTPPLKSKNYEHLRQTGEQAPKILIIDEDHEQI
jgi:hypothetical protein